MGPQGMGVRHVNQEVVSNNPIPDYSLLCLTEATLVGSSTHDFTVRTDPIMRRPGKTRTPWARGVMLPLGARLSNGTSGFFLGAGGGARRPRCGALISILRVNPIVNDLPSAFLFANLSKPFTFQRRFLEISVVGVNLPYPKSFGYSEM